MGITITPTNSDKEYAEIRGNLAESACMLGWQAFKVYKLDEMTIALAGWLQSSIGIDVYPREKQLKFPVWSFKPLLHGSVPEWIIPEAKFTNGSSSKFIPKKTALEIYDEVKQILEQELNCDYSIANLLSKLRNKFGDSEAAEILNTVIYGILSK